MFSLAAEAGVLSASPDLGQPPVDTGQQEGKLESQRDEGQDQSYLLAPEEDAVMESQELLPAVSHGVNSGENEAEPAQP